MRLHYSATSPYVRKVLVLLHETDQINDVDLSATGGTPLDSSAMPLAQNPLGKIPVLERPEGPALYDSRVICQYFAARAQSNHYPDAPALWDTLVLEATADGILDAAVAMVYEIRLRPEDKVMPELIEGLWQKIIRAVDTLETRWMGHLSGNQRMDQIAVASALAYVDFRHSDRDWRVNAPALSAWFAEFSKRPSMVATSPES